MARVWEDLNMQVIKYTVDTDPTPRVGTLEADRVTPLGTGLHALSELLHCGDVGRAIRERAGAFGPPLGRDDVRLLAPIDGQEVWGAGVTYERSKVARQEESERGASFYDDVYRADRPELFFKATPSRVVGPGQSIRIRQDTAWSVPEPELTLVLSPALQLVGYTIGNDVSARDIEGRNPLYLPQAKVYDACCALGPAILLAPELPAEDALTIDLTIHRDGAVAFEGRTSTARIVRRWSQLIEWLGRDNSFPDGAILLTGTGIVPPDEFTLRTGDTVAITIDSIGTLSNPVIQTNTEDRP
jgi:2-dehydro-3-deoxy-D-arabinonate dehydratase